MIRVLRATFYITDDRKVEQSTDPLLIGPVDTLFCELQARGERKESGDLRNGLYKNSYFVLFHVA
jgi:hypothetical protein